MKTFIVLIPLADFRNARKVCENIENTHFEIEVKGDGYDLLTAHKVLLEIDKVSDTSKVAVEVYTLTDFMESFNDEEIDADNYFMSYVTATIKK